jgi:hypothetical protein
LVTPMYTMSFTVLVILYKCAMFAIQNYEITSYEMVYVMALAVPDVTEMLLSSIK